MLRGRRSPPPLEDAPPSPRSSEYGAEDADDDFDDHDGAPGGDEGASGGGGGWVRGGGSFADGCAECGEPRRVFSSVASPSCVFA
jgi:hypothetical protein